VSDMETGRKAGGAGGPFTAAVLIVMVMTAGLFLWQLLLDG